MATRTKTAKKQVKAPTKAKKPAAKKPVAKKAAAKKTAAKKTAAKKSPARILLPSGVTDEGNKKGATQEEPGHGAQLASSPAQSLLVRGQATAKVVNPRAGYPHPVPLPGGRGVGASSAPHCALHGGSSDSRRQVRSVAPVALRHAPSR